MIPNTPVEEPKSFDAKARRPGNTWLEKHPGELPKGDTTLWRLYLEDLKDAFRGLCGYGAMWEPSGTVDHHLSQKNHRDQIFEWTNYRYIAGWVNQSKKPVHDGKLLDPFDVQAGWFRVQLPSCQMVADYSVIPPAFHARVQETLRVLHLDTRENLVELRREWYRMYEEGELTLEGLRKKAPLVAEAVAASLPPTEGH
jgi:hypothetical protein